LEDVAREAGVSRRTVYLHFENKAALLLAYAHHEEAGAGLPGLVEAMVSAETPGEMFDALARAQVEYVPLVFPSMRLVHAARGSEPAADEVWRNRMEARRRVFRILVTRLQEMGELDPALTIGDATHLLWVLTSPHMYEYLVVDGGWDLQRYRRHVVRLLGCALLRSH
jgi:AcrR family transcriptional regulator